MTIGGVQLGLSRSLGVRGGSSGTGPWGMISTAQRMERGLENDRFNSFENPNYNPYENRHQSFIARMLMRYGYSWEDEEVTKARLNKEAEDKGRRLISPA